MPDQREDPVDHRTEQRDHPEREVERETDETGEEEQQEDEPEDDDEALQAVRPDLLLERHVPASRASASNETSGTEVSPCAEKNSRARKPRGFAMRSHGNVCTPVLKAFTVAL